MQALSQLSYTPTVAQVQRNNCGVLTGRVVDLPYAKEASHSHGYKAVGYKFPENSVGWYLKTITVPQEDLGKHLYLQFDGIFRDARIWINGFYPVSYTHLLARQVWY